MEAIQPNNNNNSAQQRGRPAAESDAQATEQRVRESAAVLERASQVQQLGELAHDTRDIKQAIAASNELMRRASFQQTHEKESAAHDADADHEVQGSALVKEQDFVRLPQVAKNNLYSDRYYREGLRRVKESLHFFLEDFGIRFVYQQGEPDSTHPQLPDVPDPLEIAPGCNVRTSYFFWYAKLNTWLSTFFVLLPTYRHINADAKLQQQVPTIHDSWIETFRKDYNEHVFVTRAKNPIRAAERRPSEQAQTYENCLTYKVIVQWSACRPESRLPNNDLNTITFTDAEPPTAQSILTKEASHTKVGNDLIEAIEQRKQEKAVDKEALEEQGENEVDRRKDEGQDDDKGEGAEEEEEEEEKNEGDETGPVQGEADLPNAGDYAPLQVEEQQEHENNVQQDQTCPQQEEQKEHDNSSSSSSNKNATSAEGQDQGAASAPVSKKRRRPLLNDSKSPPPAKRQRREDSGVSETREAKKERKKEDKRQRTWPSYESFLFF